jgi:hypothetical protein
MFRLPHRNQHHQQQSPVINQMEFAAWLTATHAIDAGTITAESRAQYESAFEAAATAYMIRAVCGTPAEAGPFEPSHLVADPADVQAAQAVADNQNRLMEISEIAMNHLDIAAQAVRENWSLVETDRAVREREAGAFGTA